MDNRIERLHSELMNCNSYSQANIDKVYSLTEFLTNDNGIVMGELCKVFDLKNPDLSSSEKKDLMGKSKILNPILGITNRIRRKALKGDNFEKDINFLSQRLSDIPEPLRGKILEQITI